MKKRSLTKLFALVFILFAVITIIINGTMTYAAQNSAYHEECVTDLRRLTTNLTGQIQGEGEEFVHLKKWFKEHQDLVQVPVDFRAALPEAEKAFTRYVADNYPGKVYGTDISFDDLDLEGQRLFVNYSFDYWFTTFFVFF